MRGVAILEAHRLTGHRRDDSAAGALVRFSTIRDIVERSRWLRSFAQARIAAAVMVLGECTFAVLDLAFGRPSYLIRMRIFTHRLRGRPARFPRGETPQAVAGAVVGSTLLVMLPLLPIFWFAESEAVASGRPWGPFIRHRLVLLAAAMLVPAPFG